MNEASYIALYEEFADLIKQNSAEILNTKRDQAFEAFKIVGFPTAKMEAYQHIDFTNTFTVDYGLNIKRVNATVNPHDVFRCDVPGINAHVRFVVNDTFVEDEADAFTLPEGVIMCSLKEAYVSHKELVEKHFGTAIANANDPMLHFNEAFAQDGIFVFVPKNCVLDKPIQLINVMRGKVDLMANSRNLIVVERGAELKLLVCEHSMDMKRFVANRTTEVCVDENAKFEYYSLENTHDGMCNLSQLYIKQERDSQVITNGITLHNGISRNAVHVDMNAAGASCWVGGVAVGEKKEQIDNYSIINHNAPHCTSHELFKYILDHESHGAFSGRIVVKKDAQKTEAQQTSRAICLSADAKMKGKPQLEIYADDVKCSHGATIGQLDEKALFYMQARGIGKDEARMLLMFAFAAEVIEHVSLDALKDRLKILVEKRLRGELSKCPGCTICK